MNMRTALVCLMLVASTVRAEWGFEAETGIVYDSNLSNSDRSADVRDDWAWRSDVSVNNSLQLTRDQRLAWRGRGQICRRRNDGIVRRAHRAPGRRRPRPAGDAGNERS